MFVSFFTLLANSSYSNGYFQVDCYFVLCVFEQVSVVRAEWQDEKRSIKMAHQREMNTVRDKVFMTHSHGNTELQTHSWHVVCMVKMLGLSANKGLPTELPNKVISVEEETEGTRSGLLLP